MISRTSKLLDLVHWLYCYVFQEKYCENNHQETNTKEESLNQNKRRLFQNEKLTQAFTGWINAFTWFGELEYISLSKNGG